MDVIAKSNGFPSGAHFNLNIHGKDPLKFEIPEGPYGSSVFVPEYCSYDQDEEPTEHIRYESGRKASVTELTVTDPVSEAFDGSPAVVQLPYEAEGYYVFARILGKPQHGKNDPDDKDRSNIILKPNKLSEEYPPQNFEEIADDDGGVVPVGLITKDAVYYAGHEAFYRFDDPGAKGKGKSKARDITHLFLFTGWVVHEDLDIWPEGDPDGVIDDNDVPSNAWELASAYDQIVNGGNGDGIIQIGEWLAYNADLVPPMAWYFAQTWIFNIADLVVTEQGLVNDGTKLLQIRFYPVATTEFKAPGYIVLDKVTNPSDDATEFDFVITYPDASYVNVTLTGPESPCVTEPLEAGTYLVTETVPEGWDLGNIAVLDPDDDPESSGDLGTRTATINLDPGETVQVTFTNTKQGVDLRVTKTDGLDEATVDDLITYTISVGNFGSEDATGVIVTDTLPSEVTYLSSNPTATYVSLGVYQWTLGGVSSSYTYSHALTITVTAYSVADPAINTVTVSSNEVDINPATNTATDETVISPIPE